MPEAKPTPQHPHPLVKLALEFIPLGVFFFSFGRFGIFPATAAFMVATVASLTISWFLLRRLPIMPLVSGVVVLVFGGLTLWLQDDLFIKLKPTIINTLFGAIILIGLAMGKPLLGVVFGEVFQLDDAGWRKLSLRWGLYFLLLAVLNEVAWRSMTTEHWVDFKVFGITALTFVFALAQVPLIQKHELKDETAEG